MDLVKEEEAEGLREDSCYSQDMGERKTIQSSLKNVLLDEPVRRKLKKKVPGIWNWGYVKPYQCQSKMIYHLPECCY